VSVLGYILTSARYYGRAHLGLLFGAFLASAILSGSLLVGDSVKASLKRDGVSHALINTGEWTAIGLADGQRILFVGDDVPTEINKNSAFIAARMSVLRGRPPGVAGGISRARRAHWSSLRSLGYPPPDWRYVARCSSVHIYSHPGIVDPNDES
jgi:hypothetical protein